MENSVILIGSDDLVDAQFEFIETEKKKHHFFLELMVNLIERGTLLL